MNIEIFKEQLKEDIELIQSKWDYVRNIEKDEFAFNYWVLLELFNIDSETVSDNITEYNDYSIDCFAFYEEDKLLHIIQNKYYSEESNVPREKIADFLSSPLQILERGEYRGSKAKENLQHIFNQIKNAEDKEYQIHLHFFITNMKANDQHKKLFDEFNKEWGGKECNYLAHAEICYLDGIHDMCYGEDYKKFRESNNFTGNLSTEDTETVLKIDPQQQNKSKLVKGMNTAYYIMTPIKDLYEIYKSAKNKDYPLFDENVRDYLGKNTVNKGIHETLNNSEERQNFFYYNNGVTIICDNVQEVPNQRNILDLQNPKIVNGCQTVSSIATVLSSREDSVIREEFKDVCVMVKVLMLERNQTFYDNIIRYTNRQNAINEKTFIASRDPFLKIQEQLEKRGILLYVKQSDKYKYKEEYNDKVNGGHKENKLIQEARSNFFLLNNSILNRLQDISIDLEKYLIIIGAFYKDGYFAFTKKSALLNVKSDIYENFSSQSYDIITIDNVIKLFSLYKRAEKDRKQSENNRDPIPYYVLSFFGFCAKKEAGENSTALNNFLKDVNSGNIENIYNLMLKIIATMYHRDYLNKNKEKDFGDMVKSKIDSSILMDNIVTFFTVNMDKENVASIQKVFPKLSEDIAQ